MKQSRGITSLTFEAMENAVDQYKGNSMTVGIHQTANV